MGVLRKRFGSSPVSWVLLAATAALLVGLNTDLSSPPRFDGAGYAVLGEALASGRGYREIDRPDAPRHAHFPPGYPAALAVLWRWFGRSAAAAHLFSAACTVAAVLLARCWYRTLYPPRTAAMLALALALNWTWGRGGGAIQSEPLYTAWELLAVLAAARAGRRDGGGLGAGIVLGLLLAACVLTRHVGACLVAATAIDLGLRRRWRVLGAALLTTSILVAPWVAWLSSVRRNTQIGLLASRSGAEGLPDRIAGQALFYLQRIPDQIAGPFVEVATVFRHAPTVALLANVWAVGTSSVVIWGWLRALRSPRRRLAALIAFTTLALLLAWPFTEAGRFLVPLLPMLLVGATEGLVDLLARLWVAPRCARGWAVALILAASIPYSAYALISGRAGAQRRTHVDFDAACGWIARHATRPGPVLTRHPGELYWQTGRRALPPDPPDPEAIDRSIDRYGVAYLLVDADRYANAAPNPLSRYVERFPRRALLVWSGNQGARPVRVFEVIPGN